MFLVTIAGSQTTFGTEPKKVSKFRHAFNGSKGTVKTILGALLLTSPYLGRLVLDDRRRDAEDDFVGNDVARQAAVDKVRTADVWIVGTVATAAGLYLFIDGINDLKKEGAALVRSIKNRRKKATTAS